MRVRSLLPLFVVGALGATGVAVLRVGAATTPPPPRLPAEGGLSFDVRDAERGGPIPCKLTLLGVDGTLDPRLTLNDIGRQEGDAIAAYNRIMSLSGSGVAHVPVGTYDVYVSRGPEWEMFVARHVRITIKGATVAARLRHSVDTAGWLSADFHVHAAASADSSVPMHDRIYEFVSDGVEMIVATDHNVVSNYQPIIDELGAGRYLTSATGDELTTDGWGHFGAFPLPHTLDRAGHGAVLVHGKSAKDFFKDVRDNAPEAIIDVHHPRIDAEIGYFNLGRFDAQSDRADRPGFSFDFDALEVLNGYQDSERRSVDRVVGDWFALLDHGHIVTATGNSDTHHLDHNIGGYPRNYVRVQEDDPQKLRPGEITRAVKGHHVLFSTAPFIKLVVGAGSIGDVVPAPGGKARAQIEVRAASWVDVTRVTLYENGLEVKRWVVPPGVDPVRLRDGFDLTATRDSYVVARVDGERTLAPIVGDQKRFDVRPFALTNPVFLDVDGNGRYDPPQHHGPHTARTDTH